MGPRSSHIATVPSTKLFSQTLFGIFLCLAALTSTQASAQIANSTPPTVITPLSTAPDPNDVNITDGRIRISVPSMSVPAAPRLNLDLVQNAMPYLVAKLGGSPVESSVSVHVGGATSVSFKCTNDDVCNSRTANGAVLEGAIALGGPYSVTLAPSGAVYTFDRLSFDSGGVGTRSVIYYASSAAYPDGEVVSYTYQTANFASGQGATQFRITQMASNIGYHINFSYQGTDVNLPAWKTVAQATLYKTSSPTVPVLQLTYSATGSVTDLAGRVFTCSGCDFRVGGQIELSDATVTLPGEASAAQTVTGSNFPSVVTSIIRDGINWNYAYANFRFVSPSPTGYGYDSVTVTGPAGYNQRYNITVGGTTTSNRISSSVDAIGRTTSYIYDINLRPTQVTMPEGDSVQIAYDKWGNILSKVSQPKPASGLTALTESAAIDAAACTLTQVLCYRITTYTDALGRVTNYAYDGAGRLIQRTDPADATGVRRVKFLSYAGSFTAPSEVRTCGLGTTCGTSGEFKTQYKYFGASPLPLTETRIDGVTGQTLTTSYTYDSAGRLLITDGPLAGTADAQFYRYDVIGRKTWEISATNASGVRVVKRYTYRDSDNKVTVAETGTLSDANATTFTVTSRVDTNYDSRRNPVRDMLSSSGTTYSVNDRTFDDRGRSTCETVRLNFAALPAVGSNACTLGTAGSDGPDRITQRSYDAASQLLKITKAVGTTDQADDATYTYSANGKPASLIDGKGNLMTLAYDGFDRQTRWTFPSPTVVGTVNAADFEAYAYDAAGNRTSFRKRDGSTLTYTYDNLNRVILKTVPGRAGLAPTHSRSVYLGYDVRNLPLYARFDNVSGEGITMVYDGFGRLKTTTMLIDGASRTLTNQFDVAGNRSELTWPDTNKTSFVYDPANRMNAIFQGALGSTLALDTFTYDGLGRKTGQSASSGAASSYAYDPVSRLNSLTHDLAGTANDVNWGFTFNPASQIASVTRNNDGYAWTGHVNVSRPYSTNGLNQYTAAGSAAFTYDANGNLTSDGSSTFTYDIENRLVGASGAKVAGLRYDPLGRLYETSGGSAGITRFLYDGDELVAEFDGAGTLLRRYIHGSAVDDPVVWYEGSAIGPARWLHGDNQGSIVAVTDASGTALTINRYDEYGIPQATNLGRFQYTGQVWVAELGMYYYKARIYSPTLGRFMQTDPIGYKDQINLYAYVANDPVNEEDPSGLCPSCVGAIIGAGLEIYDQVASGEASRTIANVGNALDRGDVLGAASAAGSSVGKIALSAGAGALGGGLAAGIERAVAGQVAKTVAVSAVGAVTNAGAQAGRNVADGRPVGSNLGRAAATGAIGAAGGRALGQAAQSRVFQNGVARINPGATAGSKGLATYDARQASRQAADRTANAVSAGVGAADSAQCRRTRCQ